MAPTLQAHTTSQTKTSTRASGRLTSCLVRSSRSCALNMLAVGRWRLLHCAVQYAFAAQQRSAHPLLGLLPAGKGRLTYADGSFYEGEWQGGERVKGRFVAGAKGARERRARACSELCAKFGRVCYCDFSAAAWHQACSAAPTHRLLSICMSSVQPTAAASTAAAGATSSGMATACCTRCGAALHWATGT